MTSVSAPIGFRLLERAALWLERYMPKTIACYDAVTTAWTAERAKGAAAALRRMKRRIVAPGKRSWDQLESELRQEIKALASGDLAALRWTMPELLSRRERLRQIVIATLRIVTITGLPIVAVLALQLGIKMNSHYVTVAWM